MSPYTLAHPEDVKLLTCVPQYVLATTPDLASFTEHLGGSHDYHHPHFINEKQKSLTQISFIQFLIENCLKIFGEDITCLFGETSVSSDNSDITDITDNSEKVAGQQLTNLTAAPSHLIKISFIQFLIENCLKIFGEDITCLFGETSVSSDNSNITDIIDNSEKVAGSSTEGIFRKSASIKSCRALQKKLNCGDTVNLNEEPMLVISSVLKDFLRNIQGSIFSASLYDKWLDVIDQRNEDDKIKAIQRLLDQLPRANVVFLRYLFAVLRNIEQHSSSNQMTAYNLSVCITPSMLCLSNSGSSENFTKQWMTGITDSTFLEKPGSNSCYLSNSADSRGYENTGKGTTKADETRMSSEKEERRIEPDFEGREYRKQE
ncbi:TPA: T-cell activation Rho GTPase-activating protein-like [Bos taurus]|nr:TPA: T-cell activation Rho GTPase-activating protein-like [Bos taurus]